MTLGDSRKRVLRIALAATALTAFIFDPFGLTVRRNALADDAKTVKIGIDLPLSGAEAAGNVPTENGVLLAIEEANSAGLPHGYRVVPFVLDDAVEGKHDPAQGAQNMRTFIGDPSVVAVVGPNNSNVAKVEIPLANEAGLAQIAPSTSADMLTRGPDAAKLRVAHPDVNTFFRVCTLDSRQGAAGAAFAKKLGLSKAFIIDDNETYGTGLAGVFEQRFAAQGGHILGHEHLLPTQIDFTPLLLKVRATGADLIFFGGVTVTGGGMLRRQQVVNGFGNITLLGGDGLSGADFLEAAGTAANGTYFTVVAPDVSKLPGAAKFVAAYKARFKDAPAAYSANGYSAAQVIIAAIAKAIVAHPDGAPTRAEVLENIANTKNLPTPIGALGFDKYGDTTVPILSLYVVKNSRPEFLNQIDLK